MLAPVRDLPADDRVAPTQGILDDDGLLPERALEEAREAEREIRAGRYRGAIATKGVRTTNGSRATGHWVPDLESAVTARLRAAEYRPPLHCAISRVPSVAHRGDNCPY